MGTNQFTKKLELSNWVKWRLFNRLRENCENIDYQNYEKYRQKFEKIPNSLLGEWNEIKTELKDNPNANMKILKGFLFETLFYYACLKIEAIFKDAEILEMEGVKVRDEYPPWFEAIPLYDVIPPLHHIHENGKMVKNPQTKGDFLISYVDDDGPLPPALVDVKSKKPGKYYTKKYGWQIVSAMRRGFIFQLAYPKEGIEYPKSIIEWDIVTYCSECGELSKEYRKCDKCGKSIFSFTIVDSYYK